MEFTKDEQKKIEESCLPVDEERLFKDYLDEVYTDIDIMGLEYAPSEVLQDVDPIRFREEMLNFLDNECRDGKIIEVGNNFYNADDIEEFLDELERGN